MVLRKNLVLDDSNLTTNRCYLTCILRLEKRNKIADDFRLKKATLNRKLKESVENRDAIGFFRAFKDLTRLQISLRDRTINTFAFSTRELVQFIKKQNTEKKVWWEKLKKCLVWVKILSLRQIQRN